VSTARRLALDPGEYNKGKAICDSPTLVGIVANFGRCDSTGRGIAVRRDWDVGTGPTEPF
jgi:hypothetical protein